MALQLRDAIAYGPWRQNGLPSVIWKPSVLSH
jgi:hypothetical protein